MYIYKLENKNGRLKNENLSNEQLVPPEQGAPTYTISSGKMEGANLMASLTGKNTSITIKLP